MTDPYSPLTPDGRPGAGITLCDNLAALPSGPAGRPLRSAGYTLFLVKAGTLRLLTGHDETVLTARGVAAVMPRQEYRLPDTAACEGYRLELDATLPDADTVARLNSAVTAHASATVSSADASRLDTLMTMLRQHAHPQAAPHLARAVTTIVADALCPNRQPAAYQRGLAYMHHFNELLTRHLRQHRQPSFYADKLCITTGYLNDIVTDLTGLSTSRYIRQRIVLMAKRELLDRRKSIQAVSAALGFTDYAYFSRLFRKATGFTPRAFRSSGFKG